MARTLDSPFYRGALIENKNDRSTVRSAHGEKDAFGQIYGIRVGLTPVLLRCLGIVIVQGRIETQAIDDLT
jgi:hypothetical protein